MTLAGRGAAHSNRIQGDSPVRPDANADRIPAAYPGSPAVRPHQPVAAALPAARRPPGPAPPPRRGGRQLLPGQRGCRAHPAGHGTHRSRQPTGRALGCSSGRGMAGAKTGDERRLGRKLHRGLRRAVAVADAPAHDGSSTRPRRQQTRGRAGRRSRIATWSTRSMSCAHSPRRRCQQEHAARWLPHPTLLLRCPHHLHPRPPPQLPASSPQPVPQQTPAGRRPWLVRRPLLIGVMLFAFESAGIGSS
jgi:hypothetical protein